MILENAHVRFFEKVSVKNVRTVCENLAWYANGVERRWGRASAAGPGAPPWGGGVTLREGTFGIERTRLKVHARCATSSFDSHLDLSDS